MNQRNNLPPRQDEPESPITPRFPENGRTAPETGGTPRPDEQPDVAVPASELEVVTAKDLLREPLPEPDWIAEGLIPAGFSLLAGPGKSGKSFLALELGLCVAQGKPFLGKYGTRRGTVIHLALEDSKLGLQSRIARMANGGGGPENLLIKFRLPPLDQRGCEIVDALLGRNPGARLAVIDSYSYVQPSKPNGPSDYTPEYNALIRLRETGERRGVSILLVHHTRKASASNTSDRIIGSIAFQGVPDNLFILDEESPFERTKTLSHLGRHIEKGELAIRFDSNPFAWSVDGSGVPGPGVIPPLFDNDDGGDPQPSKDSPDGW